MKILVIGFPRSGTSLTHRIFKNHKDVTYMYFETLLLWKHRNKKIENLFKGFKKNENGGEKIIYERTHIWKKREYKYLEYCDWWNEQFKEQAKIVQIIRHPYDSWNSVIKNKYIPRRRQHVIVKMLNKYFQCVSENIRKIDSYPNTFTFKFEHLITEPELILDKLYTHAGLDPTRTGFNERFRGGKTFLYKKNGFVIDKDQRVKNQRDEYWKTMNKNLPELIKLMNEFDGPEYEV